MQTTFLILVATSIVVTTIVNFIKPAYEKLSYANTISILLSLILGTIGAFSIKPYLEIELTTWALFLIWLAIWTGATVWYDLRKLVQNQWKSDLPKIK